MSMAEKMHTILLITESALKEKAITDALENDFEIRTIQSIDDALESFRYFRPDIIIIDEKTEAFSCEAFAKAVKTFEGYETIPLLVLSKALKKSYVRELISAGATDIIREPINATDIQAKLKSLTLSNNTKGKISGLAQNIPTLSQNTTKKSLSDRLFVDERVHTVLVSATQHHDMMSLLIVEIDEYDALHKEHGNTLGKHLLLPFEKHLKQLVRPQDVITRIDRGRFVIIMPKTSQTAATCIAENIQDYLKESPFKAEGINETITASIGLANTSEIGDDNPHDNLQFLIDLATKCLSEAKLQGNKIVSRMISIKE